MPVTMTSKNSVTITSMSKFAQCVDYSLLSSLTADPQSTETGNDHFPRQVFSGHYVPVTPTPIAKPEFIAHSKALFEELGFSEELAKSSDFVKLFSGDMTQLPEPMRQHGWATGYALSIYGTEYTQQCPFQTGNGYGDGRALSIVEGVFNGKRWEMQLKGSGPTPYCRGADGRAVLRSSVREFLAQEHMHALGISTTRSLCLVKSITDTADRPWYREGSSSFDPEIMVQNQVAISTRVAPSFLRVGQLELFGRRARSNQYPEAQKELETIVLHLIDREYGNEIPLELPLDEKVVLLAKSFQERLSSLVANWVRVGYCQGNFNSDNCAGGGFTLDYGPFGFCEMFDPVFQPWTGGGRHFSFLNQPIAAQKNFDMFCRAVTPLLQDSNAALHELEEVSEAFSDVMEQKMQQMWAAKLGLDEVTPEFVIELLQLMMKTSVDYTLFFRELSHIPSDASGLLKSFYSPLKENLIEPWSLWFKAWREQICQHDDLAARAQKMRQVNPKYTWREWLVAPAYQQAETGDYSLIYELQEVFSAPYEEQTKDIEEKYYQLRPQEYFNAGGISHYSCSS